MGVIKDWQNDHHDYLSLTNEQQETVKKITAEFPFITEFVSGVYISTKFSEEETKKILMERMMRGW